MLSNLVLTSIRMRGAVTALLVMVILAGVSSGLTLSVDAMPDVSPVQVTVLPIADRHLDYARSVREALAGAGLRATVDERQEKIGFKIREAQVQKVPYMLVVGDREAADGTVGVRHRAGGDLGARPTDEFVTAAVAEVQSRAAGPVMPTSHFV